MSKDDPLGGAGAPVIFVVDDEPMLLDLAQVVLGPEGFDVQTFRDPARALAEYKAAATPPALVITDYAMDGMNGLDLARDIRRLQPKQKIILLSGTVDESVFAITEVKPDLFVSKPYNVDRFIKLVKKLISS